MARPPKVQALRPDHNDPECLAQIKDRTLNIIALKKQRESINAKINSDRKAIKALNVNMEAWAGALKRFEMDPDQREEFDRSRMLCDNALGVPQGDLFGLGMNPAPMTDKPAPVGRVPDSLN